MSNSILEDDGSDHWRMGKFEQSNSPQSPSTISSHSDLSHMSFRTEYSLRNGLSDSGPMISMRDRQENLNHSSMILKKCQEALAAKLSVRSRRHSASHTDMEQINYPKETIPEPSSLQFMPDHRRVPHYYTGHATPHMAPHSAHHPTYYPAPHTPQYSAPHTPQYSAPHSAQHSTLHTPQHSAPHAPQHPASSDRLDDVRRSSISEMPDSPASLPRLGEVMNPDGESPLLVSDNAERMGTTSSKAGNKHRPRILHLKQHIPGDLMRSLCEVLDNLKHDASTHAGLFSGTRNKIWTDIIDPELCLRVETQSSIAPEPPEEKLNRFRPRSRVRSHPARPPPKKYWQSAEAEADQHGQVRWKSWLNHLSADRHKDLLEKIASLATLALPQLEKVVGATLKGRQLQFVVGAFEHRIDASGTESHKVSDWHIDGLPGENIIATATSYLHVSEGLEGGCVEFAQQGEVLTYPRDPSWAPKTEWTEAPATGSMLVFNNRKLVHRVSQVSKRGRRLLLALHLVDPDRPHRPSAGHLPRQLSAQAKQETLSELKFMIRRQHPCVVARNIYELIWRFACTGVSFETIQRRRNESRVHRLHPSINVCFPGGTGHYEAGCGPVIGGTGLADHEPYDVF